MIPPSSLAKLVLGYLEEEGLQRTAETFQEECSDAQKDPFTQYSSLKTILEEYVQIKETASNPDDDPAKVISALWKKLDVVVGQLKYHTIPENKIPRVKNRRTCRGSAFGNLKIARPVPGQSNRLKHSNNNKKAAQNKQDFVSISNGNQPDFLSAIDADSPKVPPCIDLTLTSSTQNNPGFIVPGVSIEQQQPGNELTQNSADSSEQNVPISQPTPSYSIDQQTFQLQNSSTSTFSNDFRQDSFSTNLQRTLDTATGKSSSDALVCTCSGNNNSPVGTATLNSESRVQAVEERCTCTIKSNSDTGIQEFSVTAGHHSVESGSNKMEILSKSPKRKGHPPKKRNFSNPSPTKSVPVNPEPSTFPENNFDLQQLLDGGNVDIDAAMPLLLDTFLSTPLLQEKLAENINKVVSSTKQNEDATEEVLSESSQVPSCKVSDAATNHQDEPQVPVDDILNLMEADPAFDALFNLLSTDVVKAASPAKVSQGVPTCSYSEPISGTAFSAEPVSTCSTTSPIHSSSYSEPVSGTASSAEPVSTCSTTRPIHSSSYSEPISGTASSAEPVSTCSTTRPIHSSSSDNFSAASVVTESLLLLASSPSKCSTSTSTTYSLDNLHPISPKEVTPEFVHKQHKDNPVAGSCVDGELVSSSGGSGYVRSLHFVDQQPAAKPKKSKPARQKRNALKTTSNKTARWRSRKLNDQNKDSQAGEPLQGSLVENIPGDATGESGDLSTINLSAVKLLQSFASLCSNANGKNGNEKEMGGKKSQGGSMVQLLQDAAIHQQVQGVSTVNQKPNGASWSSSKKKSIPGCLLQSLAPTTASPSLSSSFNGSKSIDQVNNVNISQQVVPPKLLAPFPLVNHQGGRSLLPCPSMQSQVYGMPLQAPTQSTAVSSLPASFTSLASASVASVTFAPGKPPSSSSPSSSLVSSSPLHQLLSMQPRQLPPQPQQPPQSLSSSYIQTPLPPPKYSPSYAQQSSSTPSSHLQTTLLPPPHLSSSSSLSANQSSLPPLTSYSQPPLPSPLSSYVPSSSSSANQSSLPPLTSYSQPPLPSPSSSNVPQSSSSSSLSLQMCESSLSMPVNQPHYLDSSHTTTTTTTTSTWQNTLYHNPSTKVQTLESNNPKTQINSQGLTVLEKSPSPVAMAIVESQGQFISITLDSNEPSPTSQKAEECVSGFISGFQGGLSCQSNNQEGSTLSINNTLGSASLDLDKDKDSTRLPKKGANRKDNTYNIERNSKNNDPSGIKCEIGNKQENKSKATRDLRYVAGCGSFAEEICHGQKRPAGQDLKENKPKKSKGCKKTKKSKSKSLPKDFDVDKFLSKLHYVEK